VLAVVGCLIGTAIAPGLGALAVAYLAMTACYSLWLRHVFVADILVIAAGFDLRALAGGVATDIYLSRWFLIVTGGGAVFLVAAKRYAELQARHHGEGARATLKRYSAHGLRLTLMAAAAVAGGAYVGWAFTRPSHPGWYVASIVPFVLWLARYWALISSGAGEAPEDLILRDRGLLLLSLLWGSLFLGGVYVGG